MLMCEYFPNGSPIGGLPYEFNGAHCAQVACAETERAVFSGYPAPSGAPKVISALACNLPGRSISGVLRRVTTFHE
jgi:hypothetical protein